MHFSTFATRMTCVLTACFLALASAAEAAETSLAMWSDANDYIGQGQDYFFGQSDGSFTATKNFGNGVSVLYQGNGEGHFWSLDFAAADEQLLSVGTYRGATGYPFQEPGEPGLAVAGDGRGCNGTGVFVVKQLELSASGEVESFWAVFEQHCEGNTPELRGDIRFNADVVVALDAPLELEVQKGDTLAFDVSATDAQGRAVGLAAAGLPQGSYFADHEDGTGSFLWTTGFDQLGDFDVVFTADNGQGGVDRVTTRIQVLGVSSLLLDSEPDDYVGQGQLRFYTRDDGELRAFSDASTARVSFQSSDGSHSWSLDFAAPAGQELGIGVFPGATRYPLQDPSAPGMDIGGDGRGCNTLTGSFEVMQIEVGAHGALDVLWVTFEQHCEGAAPALRGEVRYNVDLPLLVEAPSSTAVRVGLPLSFQVRGLTTGGGTVALTASDLPAGATFVDQGDSTGTFAWTPGASQVGPLSLRFTGSDGQGHVDSAYTAVFVGLPNDDFDDATVIPSLPFSEASSIAYATRAADDPNCSWGEPTIWYALTVTEDVNVVVSARSADGAEGVGVFTGERGALTWVECGQLVSFYALPGTTFHIMVASHEQTVTLSVAQEGPGAYCTGTPVFLPAAAHAAGVAGTVWRTDVAVYNGSGAPVDLKMRYLPHDTDNSSAAWVDAGSVAAGATQGFDDLLATLFGVSSGTGGVAVCVPFMGVEVMSRTYNRTPTGTYGQEIPGRLASDAIPAGLAGNLLQLHQNAEYRTNVGLLNITDQAATGDFYLYADSGMLLGTRSFNLPPFGQHQENGIFASVGATDVENGRAQVWVTSGAVLAYASVIDNATGDPSYVEP